MTDETLADLQARLAALDELEQGPHADVPIIGQEIKRARAYIEDLIDAYGRGPEAFAIAIREDRPERTPRALMGGGEALLTARDYLVVLPDDEHPEQVWIRWHDVPPGLRDDVISLASMFRDVIAGRKIGRPKKRTHS
jgi:hypothetical protein